MITEESLTNTFVVTAVAEAQASLQAIQHFIAMMRDCDPHDQFYHRRFGTFTIIEGCGPVALCGKGLVIALHGVLGPEALCGKRFIIVLHDTCGQLPFLW